MVTLNLYELTEDKAEEEESVDMNDTEKQLDKVCTLTEPKQTARKQSAHCFLIVSISKVKMFIQDHSLAQTQLWTEKNRTEKGQGKKEQSQPTGKKIKLPNFF